MSVQNTTKKVTSSEETAGILLDHTTESAVINSQLIPSTPQATLLFMQGYQEYQQGDIIQGGKVRIEYEPGAPCLLSHAL